MKATYLYASAGALLLAVLLLTPARAQHEPRTLGLDQSALKALLATDVTLEFDETPLSAVVTVLAKEHNVPLQIDFRTLEEEGLDGSVPVTIHLQGVPLEDALEAMLRPLDLTWVPRKRTLEITSIYGAEASLITRIYPVMDLVSVPREERLAVDSAPLIDTIEGAIEPETWEVNGGMATLRFHLGSGSLICSHTWQAHQKIEELLNGLRDSRDSQEVDWSTVESEGRRRNRRGMGFGGGGGGGLGTGGGLFNRADSATPVEAP